MKQNFVQALIAVIAGNALYFWWMPHLPPRAQHHVLKSDWGLVVDFWFCLVALGIVKIAFRWWNRRHGRNP